MIKLTYTIEVVFFSTSIWKKNKFFFNVFQLFTVTRLVTDTDFTLQNIRISTGNLFLLIRNKRERITTMFLLLLDLIRFSCYLLFQLRAFLCGVLIHLRKPWFPPTIHNWTGDCRSPRALSMYMLMTPRILGFPSCQSELKRLLGCLEEAFLEAFAVNLHRQVSSQFKTEQSL